MLWPVLTSISAGPLRRSFSCFAARLGVESQGIVLACLIASLAPVLWAALRP